MQYTIKSDALTIGVAIELQEAGLDLRKQLPILEKILDLPEGMRVTDIPVSHVSIISEAIQKEAAGKNLGNLKRR